MALPANTWSARAESIGADTSTSRGTALTGSGTANIKGSWATLGTTTFAYAGFSVVFGNNGSTVDYVVDVGVDNGSGDVFVLAADLRLAPFPELFGCNSCFYIPVIVASGAQLVARVAGNVSSAALNLSLVGYSSNPGGYPGFSRCICLNTISTSRGIAIDPGGTANTKGSWAEIVSATPVDLVGLLAHCGYNNDSSRAAEAFGKMDIGLGAGGAEFVLIPDLMISWDVNLDGPLFAAFPAMPCQIPAGTRVAARGLSNINTAGDRTWDATIYGLVA